MDPQVVAANAATQNLTAVATTAFNPASGVLQPFRAATSGAFQGYYNVPNSVPFIYLAPAAGANAGNWPLVIYQHGITSYKETVLSMAQSLTGSGFAVVAIDLPLHGDLAVPTAYNVSTSGAPSSTVGALWGDDFMAVGAPLATRSNIQQGAFNLDRLDITVATGGFNYAFATASPSLAAYGPNYTAKPKFVGLSLGSIVGAYYLAGNTTLSSTGYPYTQTTLNADMKGYLSVIGGRTAYIIQNSPAFGPSVNAGLAALTSPILPGTPTYNEFFQATQMVVDTVDPATMTTPLAAGLPSRLSNRVVVQEATSTTFAADGVTPTNGDLVITNPYTRYFGNALGGEAVLGTAGAAVDPGFAQVGTGTADTIPYQFMLTVTGTTVGPKDHAAALSPVPVTADPTEGYFQFNQTNIEHGAIIDPKYPANLTLIQGQMVYFFLEGIVIDPTASIFGL